MAGWVRGALATAVVALVACAGTQPAAAATQAPAGFVDEVVVPSVGFPTAVEFTPDGFMLVATKWGVLTSYRLDQPGAAVRAWDIISKVCSDNERGFSGLAVDPQFASTRWVYVFYTRRTDGVCTTNGARPPAERVSRVTLDAAGRVVAGSEVVLLDGVPNRLGIHNGGDLAFGKDGHLYASFGDGGCDYAGNGCGLQNDASRDRNSLVGKIARITRTGGIPIDNPHAGGSRCNAGNVPANQVCAEMYATGFRNPFRIALDPNASGVRLFANDVGANVWEEINHVQPGRDYGWNVREGNCLANSRTTCPAPGAFTNPILAYDHNIGCTSIVGAAFVPGGLWPAPYDGAYIFGDYTCQKFFRLVPQGTGWTMEAFATALEGFSPVAVKFGPAPGGRALYYTGFYPETGFVRRLRYVGDVNRPPTAQLTATPSAGDVPLEVTLDARGSGDPDGDPLTYRFDPGDGSPPVTTGEPTLRHTYTADGAYDATVVVLDDDGAASPPASARVDAGNTPPHIEILSPSADLRFTVGQEIVARARVTDAQDGTIPDASISWVVERRHDAHTHPYFGEATGSQIRFTGPLPEDHTAVLTSDLRVTVRAVDSEGLVAVRSFPVLPKIVTVAFNANRPDAVLTVNGQSFSGRREFRIWARQPLYVEAGARAGLLYRFKRWQDESLSRTRTVVSDGGGYYEAIYALL